MSQEKGTPVAYGINVGGNTLTLAWAKPLPKIVYVNGVAQQLITTETVKEGAALYAPLNFKNLTIASVPEEGVYDVQLITFPENSMPQVYWGEIINGDIKIPQGPLAGNALVLYKTAEGWLPLGLYTQQGNILVSLQNLPLLSAYIQNAPYPVKNLNKEIGQKYYVLENAYQQLVFTNVGGALVEINLPFETNSNSHSAVKEIEFDREIANNYSENAHFPSHPYYTPGLQEAHPSGKIGGYYPLLRRSILGKNSISISPQFYALNIVSDYPEMAELFYDVKEFSEEKLYSRQFSLIGKSLKRTFFRRAARVHLIVLICRFQWKVIVADFGFLLAYLRLKSFPITPHPKFNIV